MMVEVVRLIVVEVIFVVVVVGFSCCLCGLVLRSQVLNLESQILSLKSYFWSLLLGLVSCFSKIPDPVPCHPKTGQKVKKMAVSGLEGPILRTILSASGQSVYSYFVFTISLPNDVLQKWAIFSRNQSMDVP